MVRQGYYIGWDVLSFKYLSSTTISDSGRYCSTDETVFFFFFFLLDSPFSQNWPSTLRTLLHRWRPLHGLRLFNLSFWDWKIKKDGHGRITPSNLSWNNCSFWTFSSDVPNLVMFYRLSLPTSHLDSRLIVVSFFYSILFTELTFVFNGRLDQFFVFVFLVTLIWLDRINTSTSRSLDWLWTVMLKMYIQLEKKN